ncbi:hypothetical protein DOTSEDRAFT_143910, partial [Dothistroma septosporum NZE10]
MLMANAPTVVTNATSDTPRIGNVLDGLKFFVVQRIPRRTGLVKDIETNGGEIVRHESESDYVIADHFRRDAPGGSYSYTFIDSAIKHGRLPDPMDHTTGAPLRGDRQVGSVIPGKYTRTPFTVQDDRDLWEFVEEAKQDGASVKGNELYKQLEKVNPRHTFQAWRDRYIKKLLDKPPPPGFLAPESPSQEPIHDPRGAANGTRRSSSEPITISSAAPSSSRYEASQHGTASFGLEQRPAGVTKRTLESQDILSAETQLPDFSMPEPSLLDDLSNGDEADEMQPQAPAVDTAQAARRSQRTRGNEFDSDDATTDVDSWILSMKARGFSNKAISKALRCTSYRPHIAQSVLFEEKRGNGLPDDTPGIWSKLEDDVLEGGDARKLRRLDEKHGSAECDARMDFLSQWREL